MMNDSWLGLFVVGTQAEGWRMWEAEQGALPDGRGVGRSHS